MSYGLQTQRTNPGNLSSLAGTTDGSLAHAKYEVGIREQSPDSRSSLAILPMYDPEVADLVGRRRYGSVHCRGGGRLESTTGPLHMWPSPATSSEILGSNPRPSDERPRYLPGKHGHTFDRSEIPAGTRTCAHRVFGAQRQSSYQLS